MERHLTVVGLDVQSCCTDLSVPLATNLSFYSSIFSSDLYLILIIHLHQNTSFSLGRYTKSPCLILLNGINLFMHSFVPFSLLCNVFKCLWISVHIIAAINVMFTTSCFYNCTVLLGCALSFRTLFTCLRLWFSFLQCILILYQSLQQSLYTTRVSLRLFYFVQTLLFPHCLLQILYIEEISICFHGQTSHTP